MKKYIHNIWMTVAVILILVLSIIAKTEIEKIIASICGVIYVLGVAKQNRISQIFGFINTGIYAYLLFRDGVYGSAIYNFCYCLPMLIYTYFNWGKDKSSKVEISKYDNKTRCLCAMGIITSVVIYYIIAIKLGVNYALVDAITIIVGMCGMYAISKKKIEQWYLFILVNLANISMWIINTVKEPSNIAMVLMYVIYIINNIYGAVSWNKELKKLKNK